MKSSHLNQRQSPLHFRRVEIKYRVADRLVPFLIDRLSPYTEIDPFLRTNGHTETSYPVTSLYFDSSDFHAMHEKDAGILSRRKIRLRTYTREFSERHPCFLEIKRRHDFIVSKDRLSLSVGHLNADLSMSHLLDHVLKKVEAREEVSAEAHLLRGWYNLQPSALVRYRRIPFVGRQEHRFRVTIDTDLEGAWQPPAFMGTVPMRVCTPGWSIVELKFNHAIPAWFHDFIQEFELTRTSYSKYATVVRLLQPQLLDW
ncbi:hypothetical protein A2635_03425 [Candidatus Peribacteria bacterium RIFCSPHIGHO2_01_FULL_51_9]|nr:MAG: hypothetical protein A2635_03425 [Candidatus Peribacteria bacterium RIFCSPHIGHO2_01_FULL_51_9]